MGTFLFGLVVGGNLVWVFMSLRRDGHWREFKARRRGSNPPPPGRKPVPPAGPPEQSLQAQPIRCWGWQADQVARAWSSLRLGQPWPEDCEPGIPAPPPDVAAAIDLRLARDIAIASRKRGLPIYGWGPGRLSPPPPPPGMRREYLWSPSQMAECGGPCWEALDPRCCDCGALWRDAPIRLDEGQTQRGNGNGGPTTPKPPIKPQPHGGQLIKVWEEPLPPSEP
jgi:hypothetical protein